MKLSWPVMPNQVRAYTAIKFLLAQAALGKSVYRVELNDCSNSIIPEVATASESAFLRYRLGRAFKALGEEKPEHFIFAFGEEGGKSFKAVAWFMLKEPELSMKTIEQDFIDRLEKQFVTGSDKKPTVTCVKFSEWVEERVVEEADQMMNGIVSATHGITRGAAQQAYIQTSSGDPIVVKKPARKPRKKKTEEPSQPVRQETAKELLATSMSLLGRGLKIAARDLTVKLREQMTSHAHSRRMS